MVIEGDRFLTESERLIVALDVPDEAAAMALVDSLAPTVTRFKVGLQLFTACGPSIVERLAQKNAKIFLDLKLHDIPNTVESAMRASLRPGVFVTDVHASGGRAMLEAAVRGAAGGPKVIGVTVLTHLTAADIGEDVTERVRRLARLCKDAGLDGVVASPQEVSAIREEVGADFLIVTPGIRPAGGEVHDQSRVATPTRALRAGASFLVVGRPITAASDPLDAARRIIREMEDAMLIA